MSNCADEETEAQNSSATSPRLYNMPGTELVITRSFESQPNEQDLYRLTLINHAAYRDTNIAEYEQLHTSFPSDHLQHNPSLLPPPPRKATGPSLVPSICIRLSNFLESCAHIKKKKV